jgi:hypothetical protein
VENLAIVGAFGVCIFAAVFVWASSQEARLERNRTRANKQLSLYGKETERAAENLELTGMHQ